jgi:hypothetical protein
MKSCIFPTDEKDLMDSHSNSLLLSATQSLWHLRSRHFAKCTVKSTIVVLVLNADHIVDRIGATYICVPFVGQTFDDRVCSSKSCRLFYEVRIGRMIRVTKRNVVFDLRMAYPEVLVGTTMGRRTDTGKSE